MSPCCMQHNHLFEAFSHFYMFHNKTRFMNSISLSGHRISPSILWNWPANHRTRVDLFLIFLWMDKQMWLYMDKWKQGVYCTSVRSPASELSYCGNLNHSVESQSLSSPALLIPVWLNFPWTIFSRQAARQHDPAFFSHCVRSLSRPHRAVGQWIKMVSCLPPHRSTTSQMRQRTKCSCAWTTCTTSHTCTSRTRRVCPSPCLWRMSSITVLRAPAAKHSSGTTHTHTLCFSRVSLVSFSFSYLIIQSMLCHLSDKSNLIFWWHLSL